MRSALLLSILCISSLGIGTGCAAKKPPPPAAPKATAVTPELKAALEKASACKYENGSFDTQCDGFKAWEANTELANAGLLELVSSEDVKLRALVADKLRVQLTADNVDADAMKIYLDAAEKEKVDSIAKTFARSLAGIDVAKFGLLDRSITIAKGHAAHDYQQVYASELRSESEPDKVATYAGELAKSEDNALRNAALRMYGNLKKSRPEVACTGLDALRADKDSVISKQATLDVAAEGKCAPKYDGILTSFDDLKLPKNPTAAEKFIGAALESICQNNDKTPAQRDRSLALAKKLAETSAVPADTRSHTLSAVLACDPKAGPAFVKKFTKDKDATVAERAKTLLQPAPAPGAPAAPAPPKAK